MSQFYHPDTGTQPTPVGTPPPQTLIPSMQPPRKQVPKKSKFAIGLLATLLFVAVFLVIGIIAKAGNAAPSPTVNVAATSAASDNLTATALTNQYATVIATSEVGLSHDLTQTAMTPTAQPTTPVVATTGVGSTQSSGPWSITINSIQPTQGGPYDSAPKSGDIYIDINFTANNTASAANDMSPVYFTLRDDQGSTYALAYITVPSDPRGTVVGGQKLRGDLSYEIPKSVHSLTLQFDSPDDLDNSQIVQWNLIV